MFLFLFIISYFDSLIIYNRGNNLVAINSSRNFKSRYDDTIRIFFLDSLKPFLFSLKEIENNYPPRYCLDSFYINENGYRKLAIGDIDNDSTIDIIIGRCHSPYFLKRLYFENNSLRIERIDSTQTPITNILLCDIDNDNKDEIFYFTSDKLKMAKKRNNQWEIRDVLLNLNQKDYGIGFGNFDRETEEKEIVCIIQPYSIPTLFKLVRLRYANNSLDTLTIFESNYIRLQNLAINDFDSNWEGEEIGLIGYRSSGPRCSEVYGYGNSWNYLEILTSNVVVKRYNDIKIGECYSQNNSKEILIIDGEGVWNYLLMIYQNNNLWQIETIFRQNLFPYFPIKSLLIGDFYKHRRLNKEILFYTYNKIYLLYESETEPIIYEIDNYPKIPTSEEEIIVKAKIGYSRIEEIVDTLYYSINETLNFYYKLRDSFSLRDSCFYYSFSPYDTNNKIFYYLKLRTPYGHIINSELKSYEISYQRKIREIQYTTDPQGVSRDTNKYVNIYAIVSGIFGNRFFIEERPKGFWNGIYVYRKRSDSLPRLNLGDSIFLIGKVKEISNLTTIFCDYDSGGRLIILERNQPLVDTFKTEVNLISESLESKLLIIDSLYFLDTGIFYGNNIYNAYNQRGEIIKIKIDFESEIPGMRIPEGLVKIIGNLIQEGNNYLLLPRLRNDFISITGIIEEKRRVIKKEKEKIYNIFGQKVKEKKIRKGIYFIKKSKGFKKFIKIL
ncbi:MAG: hypothetical protein ABIK90_04350 [candidate division WOR-3 bacterium]